MEKDYFQTKPSDDLMSDICDLELFPSDFDCGDVIRLVAIVIHHLLQALGCFRFFSNQSKGLKKRVDLDILHNIFPLSTCKGCGQQRSVSVDPILNNYI